MMKISCSWCGRSMGEKPGPAGMTSHSMCASCSAIINAELDAADAVQSTERFIEEVARERRAA